MDGVIVDSEDHWKQVELEFFSFILPGWTLEKQQSIIGLNINDVYKVMTEKYALKIDKITFSKEVKKIAIKIYSEKCNLIDGFLNTIIELKNKGFKIGLASSSMVEWIDIVVDRFNIRQYFDIIVSADEINGKGKPEPDIYLHTAKMLNSNPEECIVIEDSHNGAKSAKSANMFCIGLRGKVNKMQDLSITDVIINNYKEFNINNYK